MTRSFFSPAIHPQATVALSPVQTQNSEMISDFPLLASLSQLVPLPIQLSGLYRYPDISLNYPVILPCPQNHLRKSDHVPDIKLVLESRGAPSPIAGHSICPESWYSDSLASPLIDLPLLPRLFNE